MDTQQEHSTAHKLFFGEDGLRSIWSILLFMVGAYALANLAFGALHNLIHQQQLQTQNTKELPVGFPLLMDTVLLLAAVIPAFAISKIEKRSFGAYGIGAFNPHRMRQFAMGLAVGLGTMCLLMLALKLAGVAVFAGALLHGVDILKWGALWAFAFLLVALAEEYLMRGFLQFELARAVASIAARMGHRPALQKRVGFWVAAGFFSLLFGLLHGNNPGESPIGLVSAALIGMVFAYSLWRTGSLWWAIGYHAAWDWAQSFLWGVADSGGVSQHRWLNTMPKGNVLLSGGATGPEGSAFIFLIAILTVAIIALTLPQEPRSPAAESNLP